MPIARNIKETQLNATSERLGCEAQFYAGPRTKKSAEALVTTSRLPEATDHSPAINAELYRIHLELRQPASNAIKSALDKNFMGLTQV